MLRRVERWAPWLIGVCTFPVYVLLLPKWPTEWDSVQLTLGVDRFDIREGSPHPPGYWLYVAAGRALRAVTPFDAKTCLQLLAAAAAAGTVTLAYVVGRDLKGRWLGWATAAFLFTSPMLLFYGSNVASYAFDALLSVVLLLLVLRARAGSWHAAAAAGALGLGAGLRPSSLLILAPLVAWAGARSIRTVRQAVMAVAAGVAGLAAWVVPMLAEQPGGAHEYFTFSRMFYKPAFQGASLFYGASWAQARFNMGTATGYTLAAVAALVPPALVGVALAVRRPRDRAHRQHVALLAVAALVPYAFVTLAFFGKAGYVLGYLPAVALLALWPAASLQRRTVVTVVVALVCLVQADRFLRAPGILPLRFVDRQQVWFTQRKYGAPYPETRAFARQTDREADSFESIRDEFDPTKDVVVYIGKNGGARFRHGCFAFQEFRVHLADPLDHFLCRRHRMLSEGDTDIEVPAADSRIVFTLDYVDDEVRAALRPHRLRSGRTVWVGDPGVTLYGVTAVVTPDHPRSTHLN